MGIVNRTCTAYIFGALILLPTVLYSADYTITTGTSTFDGDTDCAGVCTSSDTIIIAGGARGNLLLRDLDGSGSYITVKNDASTRVVMTNDDSVGSGVLSLDDCKYVDLRGNNLGGETYGIKVIHDGPNARSSAVYVYGESDHIKLSYLEIAFDGNTASGTSGIKVQDTSLSDAWTYDTFEIHHNWIHDSRYSAMYLGHNDPRDLTSDVSSTSPYLANFLVHDNLLEDSGSYGITMKGIEAGTNKIYDNTIDTTGVVFYDADNSAHHGIHVHWVYGNVPVEIYGNTVIDALGPGIMVGNATSGTAVGGHLVHDNKVLGCGAGNNASYGHGIVLDRYATNENIYDNIIIQPGGYGIFGYWTQAPASTMSRNLIGDAGTGEWSANTIENLTESTGADANVYHADVASFGFTTWSDDGDYSNDVFTFVEDVTVAGVGTTITGGVVGADVEDVPNFIVEGVGRTVGLGSVTTGQTRSVVLLGLGTVSSTGDLNLATFDSAFSIAGIAVVIIVNNDELDLLSIIAKYNTGGVSLGGNGGVQTGGNGGVRN